MRPSTPFKVSIREYQRAPLQALQEMRFLPPLRRKSKECAIASKECSSRKRLGYRIPCEIYHSVIFALAVRIPRSFRWSRFACVDWILLADGLRSGVSVRTGMKKRQPVNNLNQTSWLLINRLIESSRPTSGFTASLWLYA